MAEPVAMPEQGIEEHPPMRGGGRGGFRGGFRGAGAPGGMRRGGRGPGGRGGRMGGMPRGRGGPGGRGGGPGGMSRGGRGGGFGGPQGGGMFGRGFPAGGGRGGRGGDRGKGGRGFGRGGMGDKKRPMQGSFFRGGPNKRGPPPKRGRWEPRGGFGGPGAANGFGNYGGAANNPDYSNFNNDGRMGPAPTGNNGGALMGDYPGHLQQPRHPLQADGFNNLAGSAPVGGAYPVGAGDGLLPRNYSSNTQQEYNSGYSDGKPALMSRESYGANQGGNGYGARNLMATAGYGNQGNANNGYNAGYSDDRGNNFPRNTTNYGDASRLNYDGSYDVNTASDMGGNLGGFSKDFGNGVNARSSTSERGYPYDNNSSNNAPPPSYSMSRESFGGGTTGGGYMPRGGGQNRPRY